MDIRAGSPRVSPTETGFDVKLEEWGYDDGAHANEVVGWVAFRSGQHRVRWVDSVSPGSAEHRIVASRLNLNQNRANLPVGYGSILQTQTVNGGAPVSARVRAGTFQSQGRLQEEESADGVHNTETMGLIRLRGLIR